MPVFKTGAFNRSATPPVEEPSYLLLRVDERLLLQEANHRSVGLLKQPSVFLVKRTIGKTLDHIGSFLNGVFDVGGIRAAFVDEEAVIGLTHTIDTNWFALSADCRGESR